MSRGDAIFRTPEPLIRRVYAYVAYRIGDGPAAEDATSETFARALRYSDSFDPRRGELIAWLLGIARRCIEEERVRTVNVPLETVEHAAPGDLAHEASERIALRQALDVLEPRERELVALRYGADLSSRRIAELLDMSPGAVDVALHRALARLRALLGAGPANAIRKKSGPAPVQRENTRIETRRAP